MGRAVAVERETLILPAPTLSGQTTMQSTSAQGGGRITVVDLQPRVRAEFGNLNAYTDTGGIVSPAEFGIRSIDALGNLIFDSSGVAGVMSLAGSSSNGAVTIPAGGGFNAVGTAVTFTAPRLLHYLILCGCSVQNPASTTSTLAIFVDNVLTGWQGSWGNTAGTGVQTAPGTLLYVAQLAAGSHTVQVYGATGGSGVGTVGSQNLYVFQLGA